MIDAAAALARKADELCLRRGSAADAEVRRTAARRVRRGVYCMDPRLRPAPDEDVVAALLVLPAGSLANGLTAARLWRLDALVPAADDEPIEILVPGRHNSARLDGCRLTFGVTTAIGLPMGVPSTTRERTITELAGRLAVSPAVAMVEAVLRFEPDLRRSWPARAPGCRPACPRTHSTCSRSLPT